MKKDYTDITQISKNNFLDIPDINHEIDNIILKNNLTPDTNDFFSLTNTYFDVNLEAAYILASNWSSITKTFLFTVIQGLGFLASKLSNDASPSDNKLAVLQTAFSVISDDLNNCHPVFNQVAPKGPNGIHFKWWQDTILSKLAPYVDNKSVKLTDQTNKLLSKMRALSNKVMGAAIQLRIVEAIARDIAATFLIIFNKVKHNNVPIFVTDADKIWILTHIEAESVHNEKVSDNLSGMALIASNYEEQ